MTSRRVFRGVWIAALGIAALLILLGVFNLLPHAKAPVDLVLGGAVLAFVAIINLIRTRRARA